MRLDDLLGNCEPQPRMVAKVARGAFGIEAVEDLGQRLIRDTGACILDHHQHAVEANLDPMASSPRRAGSSSLAQVRGARRARHRRVLALVVEKHLMQQRALASDTLERKRPKASTTDPEARVMKMPHGGYEPAYNVQFAAVANPMGGPVAIVGVQVTQTPSDQGSVLPMVEQIEARTGRRVRRLAVDSNHVSQPALQQAQARGLELISRPPENWKTTKEKKKRPKGTL